MKKDYEIFKPTGEKLVKGSIETDSYGATITVGKVESDAVRVSIRAQWMDASDLREAADAFKRIADALDAR